MKQREQEAVIKQGKNHEEISAQIPPDTTHLSNEYPKKTSDQKQNKLSNQTSQDKTRQLDKHTMPAESCANNRLLLDPNPNPNLPQSQPQKHGRFLSELPSPATNQIHFNKQQPGAAQATQADLSIGNKPDQQKKRVSVALNTTDSHMLLITQTMREPEPDPLLTMLSNSIIVETTPGQNLNNNHNHNQTNMDDVYLGGADQQTPHLSISSNYSFQQDAVVAQESQFDKEHDRIYFSEKFLTQQPIRASLKSMTVKRFDTTLDQIPSLTSRRRATYDLAPFGFKRSNSSNIVHNYGTNKESLISNDVQDAAAIQSPDQVFRKLQTGFKSCLDGKTLATTPPPQRLITSEQKKETDAVRNLSLEFLSPDNRKLVDDQEQKRLSIAYDLKFRNPILPFANLVSNSTQRKVTSLEENNSDSSFHTDENSCDLSQNTVYQRPGIANKIGLLLANEFLSQPKFIAQKTTAAECDDDELSQSCQTFRTDPDYQDQDDQEALEQLPTLDLKDLKRNSTVRFNDDAAFFQYQTEKFDQRKSKKKDKDGEKEDQLETDRTLGTGGRAHTIYQKQSILKQSSMSDRKSVDQQSIRKWQYQLESMLMRKLNVQEVNQLQERSRSIRKAATFISPIKLTAAQISKKEKLLKVQSFANPQMLKQKSQRTVITQTLLDCRKGGSDNQDSNSLNSSFDELNSQGMCSLDSEVFRKEFEQDTGFGHVGNLIKKESVKKQKKAMNESIASAYNSPLKNMQNLDQYDSDNSSVGSLMDFAERKKKENQDELDINHLFDDRIQQEEVFEILDKLKPQSQDNGVGDGLAEKINYDDYNECAALLKAGIHVIKHHYSSTGFRKVNLWLSKDESCLYYKPLESINPVREFFRGARAMSFTNIKGFVYGPYSTTFETRKSKVLDAFKYHSEALGRSASKRNNITVNMTAEQYFQTNQDNHDHNPNNNQDRLDGELVFMSDGEDQVSDVAELDNLAYRRVTDQSYQNRLFMDREEQSQWQRTQLHNAKSLKFATSDGMFHAWECVTIIMSNSTTVDVVVRDMQELMALIHVLHHKLHQPKKQFNEEWGCLKTYKFLKIKMKLSYTARKQQMEIADLFYQSLYRTLKDLRILAVYKLQILAAYHGMPTIENSKRGSFMILDEHRESQNHLSWEKKNKKLSFLEQQNLKQDDTLRKRKPEGLMCEVNLNFRQSIQKPGEFQEQYMSPGLRFGTFCKKSSLHNRLNPSSSTLQGGDFSPRGGANKAFKRLNKEKKKYQRLEREIVAFIKMTDRQMLYLNLIKEDQYNPWLEIVRSNMLNQNQGVQAMCQSFQFYLIGNETKKMRQRHTQRVKLQVDFDCNEATIMQMIQAAMLMKERLLDRYGRELVGKLKIRRRQIANMQASIKQCYVLSIKFLEIEMNMLGQNMKVKRRKIAKKRTILIRELNQHISLMRGEGKRIEKFTRQHAHFQFFKVMNSLRRAQKLLDEVANTKFDAHLKSFGKEFDQAKLRIKQCNLEKYSLKHKFERYSVLFDLPIHVIRAHGIEPENLLKFRMQFRQRYLTLKRAIRELEDGFGIMVVHRKLTLNGVRGNDQASFEKQLALENNLSLQPPVQLNKHALQRLNQISVQFKLDEKKRQQKKLMGVDTHDRVVLYNPDQSSQGNLSDYINDISDIDLDEEFENIMVNDKQQHSVDQCSD